MNRLYLLEPATPSPEWAPFGGVRPIAELRAGSRTVRAAWEQAVGTEVSGVLAGPGSAAPPEVAQETVRGPAIVAASWFVPSDTVGDTSGVGRLLADGETVGWVLPAGAAFDREAATGRDREVSGLRLKGTYSLLDALDALLARQCADWGESRRPAEVPTGSVVLGDPSQVYASEAAVEPGVVFDVRKGPIVLEPGSEVRHGTRLEGPIHVARDAIVWGGFIRHSVIGPQCRVRGEVSHSVFLGYANKAHDGFVGHSILGHWSNLGALTTTSNLKNTYGEVRLSVDGATIPTGRQFVGTFIGDHAKTAIGTMLGTGTVVSVGANLFGPAPVPRYVPPFAWGNECRAVMDEAGFIKTAKRVMPRRGVEVTEEREAALRALYARSVRR